MNAQPLAGFTPPPTALSVDHTASVAATAVIIVWFLIVVGRAIPAARAGDRIPLYMLIGGLFLAPFIEPILDHLGMVWYAKDNLWIFSHMLDRPMPALVLFGWVAYWGGCALLAYNGARAGRDRRWLWNTLWFCFALDLFAETIAVTWLGVYVYYGPQPFDYWGVPLWYMWMNPGAAIVLALTLNHHRERIKGLRGAVLVVLSVPATVLCFYAAACWPLFIALNTPGTNAYWIHLAGAVSVGQAFLLIGAVIALTTPKAGRERLGAPAALAVAAEGTETCEIPM
jgi:hypothetical protein